MRRVLIFIMTNNAVSINECERIRELTDDYSYSEIAEMTGRHYNTVISHHKGNCNHDQITQQQCEWLNNDPDMLRREQADEIGVTYSAIYYHLDGRCDHGKD